VTLLKEKKEEIYRSENWDKSHIKINGIWNFLSIVDQGKGRKIKNLYFQVFHTNIIDIYLKVKLLIYMEN